VETVAPSIQIIDEIDWDDLTRDVHKKRCILFLGPALPVYPLQGEKYDFYSLAAIHLSRLLKENNFEYDSSQSQDLYYIARKYLAFKNYYRMPLQDEIADLYKAQVEQLKRESNEAIPDLYKTILLLPWHTIVNMQPDSFFEGGLKPNQVFAFYNYKISEEKDLKVDRNQFLVYNLSGAAVKDNSEYNLESLVLTEEDHVEFVRNLVRGTPKVPESVISRFDDNKIFIFLDCNLGNWHFRLLMEMLKIHKGSHTFSPRLKSFDFPPSIVEFYKYRYGFVFINNNSEEFINKLCEEYKKRYEKEVPPPVPKKLFLAYYDPDEDSDEHDHSDKELAQALLSQFGPLVHKGELSIWTKENILPGDLIKVETEQFQAADGIILVISAQFLNEPTYSRYIEPALSAAQAAQSPKKVFAVIKNPCLWQETPLNNLPPKYILPTNHIPIRYQQQEKSDKILYEIVSSIKEILWE
jgi:hypothetical protein